MNFAPELYDELRVGAIRSAALTLPIVLSVMKDSKHAKGWPEAALDVGAGEGWWSEGLRQLRPDCMVRSVDENAGPGVEAWQAGDALPVWLPAWQRKWPLVLCLELAEHLTEQQGDWLVGELCRVGERIVWSAAIPGQGGHRHVNEQWPDYWHARFLAHGYALRDPWRDALWALPGVEPWYAQNLLLARPLRAAEADCGVAPPRSLVHPTIFNARVENAAHWREEYLASDRRVGELLR